MKAIDKTRYCPVCGDSGFERSSEKSRTCKACGFIYYFNCGAAVAVILECDGEFLLTIRAKGPGKGRLGLPGGFVDEGESLEDAVRREAFEEIGIEIGELAYLGSYPNTYPYKGIDVHTCDAFFLTRLESKPELTLSEEIDGVEWYPLDCIPVEKIAFASLRKAVQLAARQCSAL